MRIGKVINDRYEIEANAGSNGVVELYDALDRQLNRPVTLQVLTRSASREPEVVQAFEAHQQCALSLYHCSVLAVYDLGEVDGRAFSVVERFNKIDPGSYQYKDATPDVDSVLRLTRQAAEGLQCCREAGLADWAFSPGLVGIDGEGNARLAIIEGPHSSAGLPNGADVAALGAFLRGFLPGKEAAPGAVALPSPVLALLDRVEGRSGKQPATAGEFALEIAAIQEVSSQPTQAHAAGPAMPSVPSASPEAATLATPIMAAAPPVMPVKEVGNKATRALPVMRSVEAVSVEPVVGSVSPQVSTRPIKSRPNRPVLLWAGGVLALILLLVVVLPRFAGVQGARATGGVGLQIAPTPTAVPLVQAPDLKGKSLEEAQVLAGGYRLSVAVGAPGEDAAMPPNTVVGQDPPVGTTLLSGSVITVSLNVVAQAQPPAPPAVVEQPPNNEPQPRERGNTGKNKDKDKDKDNDD